VSAPPTCYGPNQLRAAYGFDALSETGAGQTIAIVAAFQSPTLQQDLDTFDTLFGIAAATVTVAAPDGLTPFDQSNSDQTSWAGRITSEVEYAHAIAPGAQIELVSAKSDSDADMLSALRFAVDDQVGNVVELNMSEGEDCVDSTVASDLHAEFQTAVDHAITVLVPAGDDGAAQPTCDLTSFTKAVAYPAADPLVTGVGGTILDADGTTGAYNGETTWNEPAFAVAGGGGFSTQQAIPDYQAGEVTGDFRGVPDVSYNSAITGGVLAVWSTSGQGANLVFQFGGTDVAAAQWTGLVALADESAGVGLGAINPRLYQLAGDPTSYAADFHDITAGDNTFHGTAVTIDGFAAAPDWDAATGLGSPKANGLVPDLAKDVVAPVVTCGSADGVVHTTNVTIPCTATDDRGLADSAQASFTLHTSVPAGQKDANAQTNSVQVCDTSGNCTTAGPIGGNMVDLTVAPPPPPPPPPATPKCTSQRRIVIHVRFHFKLHRNVHIAKARVSLDGKLLETVHGRNAAATIDLTGRPAGSYRVSILAQDSRGRSHRWTTTYRTCAPRIS
jgi:hypothetical protein